MNVEIAHAGRTRREGVQSVRELAALEAEVAMLRELVLMRLAEGYSREQIESDFQFAGVNEAER